MTTSPAVRDAVESARQLALREHRRVVLTAAGIVPQDSALPERWSGVLAIEGVASSEERRRIFAPGAIDLGLLDRDVLPLRWAEADRGGHEGAVVVGGIDSAERVSPDDPRIVATGLRLAPGSGPIWGCGRFDLRGDDSREAARLVAAGIGLVGVSIDADRVRAKPEPSGVLLIQQARLRAATLVATPAIARCRIFADATRKDHP